MTPKQNVASILLTTPLNKLTFKKLAFHNLSDSAKLPPCTSMLLGLGSKFCIEKRLASKHLNKTFSRLTRQVRLRAYFYHSQLPTTIHPLYMRSDFQPPNAPTNVEYALDKFKFTIISLTKN